MRGHRVFVAFNLSEAVSAPSPPGRIMAELSSCCTLCEGGEGEGVGAEWLGGWGWGRGVRGLEVKGKARGGRGEG